VCKNCSESFNWRAKQRHVDCCNDWIENTQNSNFLKRVTGDEFWICEYDPETKRQNEKWKHRGSPRTKKRARIVQKSKYVHSFFLILMIMELFIMNMFQRVNLLIQFYWRRILKHLRERVRRTRSKLRRTYGFCIRTTHLRIRRSLRTSFWPKTILLPQTTLPIHLI